MSPSNALFSRYQPTSDALRERVILITGASGAIGGAVAEACAARGATVILHGRRQAPLEKRYDAIEAAGQRQAALMPLDFSKAEPQAFEEMASIIQREFGRLDGLVHCAASLGNLSPFELADRANWQRTLQINLHAPCWLTQACLPLLKQSQTASVVFTLDEKSRAYWGAYGIAKAALQAAMRILADEYENPDSHYRLKIAGILPGATRSALRLAAYPAEDPRLQHAAERWVRHYLYLLDPVSGAENGEILNALAETTQTESSN